MLLDVRWPAALAGPGKPLLCFIVLNVHPRISQPGCLVDGVTAAALPGFSEIRLAHLLKIGKANVRGRFAHLLKDFFGPGHRATVSL